MSVTMRDVLALPCLREARVVAGQGGLDKIVSSISVLEYAQNTPLFTQMMTSLDFIGSELAITGFTNVPRDVEAQCNAIRMSSAVGIVGMLLYYVGIFMPGVDQRLIDLADSLDFVLVCMPENRNNLRYSEAITEVMEAILRDQTQETYFIPQILEQLARLPDHLRSMDALLKLLSDRVHASLALLDGEGRTINCVTWPRGLEESLTEALRQASPGPAVTLLCGGESLCGCRRAITNLHSQSMELVSLRTHPLNEREITQLGEAVQLFVNIWSEHHGEAVMAELIRAIMLDEPIKMRRLADVLGVDIAAISTLWMLQLPPSQVGEESRLHRQLLTVARDTLSPHCRIMFGDVYEGSIVLFLADPLLGQNAEALCEALLQNIQAEGLSAILYTCPYVRTTADVRRAYLAFGGNMETALRIFPGKTRLTRQEIGFAAHCNALLAEGEQARRQYLEIIEPLYKDGTEDGSLETLTVFLLDGESSIAQTAERMYLHPNTIKYRIRRIREKLGFSPLRMPEAYDLYQAVALYRLLHS